MNLTTRQILYGALAIIGLVATWYFNLAFMDDSGGSFSIVDFVKACYANNASTSISNDITVAVLAFLVWSFFESDRLGMRHWWVYVVLTFAVAFAFSYPLFLLMRERRLQAVTDSVGSH